MKVLYIILMSLFLSGVSSVKVHAADDFRSRVIGKWEVGVPYLPGPPNQSFILVIREQDKRMVFDVQDGRLEVGDLIVKDMKFIEKKDRLLANLYVGEFVTIIIWEEKGVIRGSIETSMIGALPLILKKL